MAMSSPRDQVLLARLLLALAVLLTRADAEIRQQVVTTLARDHEIELIDAVVKRAA